MAILFSNEIMDAVVKELKNASRSVQIITAYCKESSFKYLDSAINESVTDKKLLVRFRMDDIIKESTDFDILEFGMKNGWDVYIRFDLHAKTYIVDNKRGLVGSANVTNSGLSIGKPGNMEMATLVDIEQQDVSKINKLYDDAILLNDELFERLKQQIETINKEKDYESHSWDTSITSLFNPHVETLFSYELPDEISLKSGEYLSFLDETFEGDYNRLKESFRWSNAYLWLIGVLKENEGCMYFGAITEKLHNALVSDPKPYRRDVKQMLANLLNLIEELDMDEMVIDRPNYSQRVRINKIRTS